ncbi:MAG: NAD(P)-binding domain-containing protein, partial [Bacteroidota bacterium]
MDRILVVGSGSWGTALVKILLENNDLSVDWWVRSDKMAQKINSKGKNPKYLRSVRLDTNRLKASTNIKQLISDNDYILLVTPSAFIADLLKEITPNQLKDKKIISAIKGVEPNSLKIVGEYLFEHKGVRESDFGVITGPCHAEEVAQ